MHRPKPHACGVDYYRVPPNTNGFLKPPKWRVCGVPPWPCLRRQRRIETVASLAQPQMQLVACRCSTMLGPAAGKVGGGLAWVNSRITALWPVVLCNFCMQDKNEMNVFEKISSGKVFVFWGGLAHRLDSLTSPRLPSIFGQISFFSVAFIWGQTFCTEAFIPEKNLTGAWGCMHACHQPTNQPTNRVAEMYARP